MEKVGAVRIKMRLIKPVISRFEAWADNLVAKQSSSRSAS